MRGLANYKKEVGSIFGSDLPRARPRSLLVLVPALLALVTLLGLLLADVLLRGVHCSVDLLVVLVVSLASGELRGLVYPLVSLLGMLLDVVLRLLF